MACSHFYKFLRDLIRGFKMKNKLAVCLLASIYVIIVSVQPTETTPRLSCSRTVRNVTFNANGTSQIFQSPSYPAGAYMVDITCTYVFKAPKGHRIELKFSDFQLEGASPECNNDYIVVRDGPSEKSPLMHKLCGAQDPDPIISSTNSLHMYFVSNEKWVFQGFNGTYRVISEVDIAKCTKGRTIAPLFSRGYLTSPTFPAKYPANRDCSWTLQAPPGHFMKLAFHVFQTQCPNDKVTIRDRDENGQLLGQFCGEPEVPVFRGRKLWVSFKSDKSIISAENGFNATYEALPFKGHISDHCIGGQTKIVNASTPGTIKSPWRPDFYPNNINCVWKIRAPKGKKVKLTFDSFELASPCGADFIEVSDVTAEDTSPKGKYCGNFPDTVSAAEDVLVRFVTDSRGRQKGFVMQYKAVNQGSRLSYSLLGFYVMLVITIHYGVG